MTFFIDQEEYVNPLCQTPGIKQAVHRQDQFPFIDEEGMEVGVGQHKTVQVVRWCACDLCIFRDKQDLYEIKYS
mgnify:CR=1 FL=1